MSSRIDICICTFRRPGGLAACLEGISRQVLQASGDDVPDVRVLVVDNDPAGTARTAAEAGSSDMPWPLDYVHEPQRGITHARTRAVRSMRSDADWIAFLDDDEVPTPGWLAGLLETQRRYSADIVAGPVVPQLEGHVPDWMSAGRFFDRQRHPTGTTVVDTGTGNVLIRAELLRAIEEPFDHRLALTGGEDTHLFMRLRRHGHAIHWCDEAIVIESVPVSRARVPWLLRRAWRGGMTYVHCERMVSPSLATAGNRAARGAFRVLRGLLLAASGLVRGRAVSLRGVLLAVNGAGVLVGLMGRTYSEYEHTHGS
ncbi:MAG: glycosyl transferase family 2 [Thermoleophilia bacterium]|nr:glycosyl transferase family 2 [Thermoleophilia bacterium]MCZ4496058.1 glycosyl transferase family 2 [Thermoleophilia bacterium]